MPDEPRAQSEDEGAAPIPSGLTPGQLAGRALTPREERFCEEYLIDLTGTRAAVRAGYSRKSAKFIACELLAKPHIARQVELLIAARCARTGVTADRVLEELATIAFSDLRDYAANDLGQMRLTPGARSSAARAVASIKRRRELTRDGAIEIGTVEFKLWDKVAALRALMPHVGLATERNEHTGKGGGPIQHSATVTYYMPVNGREKRSAPVSRACSG